MTIYIESLSSPVTPEDLKQVFAFGLVKRVTIPSDRKTGQVWGFAFVEKVEAPQKKTAISALDGAKWIGRQMLKPCQTEENPRKEGDRGRLADSSTCFYKPWA
jgi:RNA recognition motif-containing protein